MLNIKHCKYLDDEELGDYIRKPIWKKLKYEACPESKDTKVLNVYNIFNLQKRHCEWIACT
jgi:hypothetical protein